MNKQPQSTIAELLGNRELIVAAINRAVREAILKHAQAGHPIAVSENGKVVWIPADEILAEFAHELSSGSAGDANLKSECSPPR